MILIRFESWAFILLERVMSEKSEIKTFGLKTILTILKLELCQKFIYY